MTQGKVMGPVDYLMIKFPGNKFSGKMAPELSRLEREGIIRVMDLVLLMRDENGKLTIVEPENVPANLPEAGAAFKEISKHTREWFSEGDIEVIGASLPNNSSAGLLLFENIWAIKFREALRDADAELIDMGRIPPENVEIARGVIEKGGS